ncbi:hypothetical protein PVBG_06112 [Plasmodium vivax Brazil I]|uniref:PIR Superfamily Protein n=1 Tax=Plasmodium vivax (strain Brazil I) TaxID=1033975 RepID=A0A0J9SXU2_PLAV1|nr:hypothetical protein PVBG_06112 [Plasmodium vivax Brazil I]
MSCSPNVKNSSYDFFDNIDTYIAEAKNIENSIRDNTSDANCNNFSNQHKSLGNKEKLKSLCNRFAILNKLLNAIKKENHNHCSFLNYWINSEWNQPRFSENNCISYVYIGLESHIQSNEEYNLIDCEYYDINKDELNKMNILYNLYEKHSEINSIIVAKSDQNKQKLLTLSTQCCADYNDVIYTCNADNKSKNPEFCDKLEAFISKYNELDNKVVGEEYNFSDYFIKLSDCPNNKIISTAVTGSIIGLIPLLGVLYKVSELNIKI